MQSYHTKSLKSFRQSRRADLSTLPWHLPFGNLKRASYALTALPQLCSSAVRVGHCSILRATSLSAFWLGTAFDDHFHRLDPPMLWSLQQS